MDISYFIEHPTEMSKETVYELRGILAIYPYYLPARLLLLHNLYLLHDAAFDEELRHSAIYLSNREMLFGLIEASHYRFKREPSVLIVHQEILSDESRTISLIDNFLESIPKEVEDNKPKRKPTPADAAVDYVSYLLEVENSYKKKKDSLLNGQTLIDDFIHKENGHLDLKDDQKSQSDLEGFHHKQKSSEEGYFTETLAKIYIKQGQYARALEIIRHLYLNYPKKNVYFADQLRFLEKLSLNNKK